MSESLYKENPLQVNRCRGDQILYGISVAVVMEAPFHDFIKNGLKIVSFFRERVLYMGRDFIELFPFDEPVRFQLAESLRKDAFVITLSIRFKSPNLAVSWIQSS